jgi:uncharacterized membrane protein YfhO
MKKVWFILLLIGSLSLFFKDTFIKQLLPIPSDTIIGLYYPYIDYFSPIYERGYPFKNFLITDPVRQTYPWRNLVIQAEKNLTLPFWNPYSLAGTPLLANFQSSALYPLNFLFFVMPFATSWSLLVILSPLLGGLFMFLYLSHKRLNMWSCLLGGISFALSGFFVAWLEWNVLTHVLLWLPLLLLCIDNIHEGSKKSIWWVVLFVFSLSSSFFAGHLQTFFYVFLTTISYGVFQYNRAENKKYYLISLLSALGIFVLVTLPQSVPGFRFILASGRDVDPISIESQSQFIPWKHVVQFVAPDFFGNPAKGNYWGEWNYGEFIAYIGLFPLILALFAVLYRKDRETRFFGILFVISLLFSLPTFFAKIPFFLHIPFLATSQSTRLLSLACFSLSALAAFGLDHYEKEKRKLYVPLGIFIVIFLALWGFILLHQQIIPVSIDQLNIAKRNMYFPSVLLIVAVLIALIGMVIKQKKYMNIFYALIFFVTLFDLLWFGTRFTTFTPKEFLYPQTKLTFFLQKNLGDSRYMSADWRILPPNFSIMYKLQSIDGYDPLFLRRYGEFIATSEREKPDLSTPFGFYKRITPYNYKSRLIDLLGVKYVLSLFEIQSPKLTKVYEEGLTKVYENRNVLPRTFFVDKLYFMADKQRNIDTLFDQNFNERKNATIEEAVLADKKLHIGKSTIASYEANQVIVKTENSGDGFLILTDVYYPTWHVQIDGMESRVYRADYVLRGVFIPKGNHTIRFYDTIF